MKSICDIKDIYKALYQFEKVFTEEHGMTINEGVVFCCMKDGVDKSANELCDFVGLSNSRVSRVINSMEEKGYINRQMGVEDKRQMIFSLTALGKAKAMKSYSKGIDYSLLEKQLSMFLDKK